MYLKLRRVTATVGDVPVSVYAEFTLLLTQAITSDYQQQRTQNSLTSNSVRRIHSLTLSLTQAITSNSVRRIHSLFNTGNYQQLTSITYKHGFYGEGENFRRKGDMYLAALISLHACQCVGR